MHNSSRTTRSEDPNQTVPPAVANPSASLSLEDLFETYAFDDKLKDGIEIVLDRSLETCLFKVHESIGSFNFISKRSDDEDPCIRPIHLAKMDELRQSIEVDGFSTFAGQGFTFLAFKQPAKRVAAASKKGARQANASVAEAEMATIHAYALDGNHRIAVLKQSSNKQLKFKVRIRLLKHSTPLHASTRACSLLNSVASSNVPDSLSQKITIFMKYKKSFLKINPHKLAAAESKQFAVDAMGGHRNISQSSAHQLSLFSRLDQPLLRLVISAVGDYKESMFTQSLADTKSLRMLRVLLPSKNLPVEIQCLPTPIISKLATSSKSPHHLTDLAQAQAIQDAFIRLFLQGGIKGKKCGTILGPDCISSFIRIGAPVTVDTLEVIFSNASFAFGNEVEWNSAERTIRVKDGDALITTPIVTALTIKEHDILGTALINAVFGGGKHAKGVEMDDVFESFISCMPSRSEDYERIPIVAAQDHGTSRVRNLSPLASASSSTVIEEPVHIENHATEPSEDIAPPKKRAKKKSEDESQKYPKFAGKKKQLDAADEWTPRQGVVPSISVVHSSPQEFVGSPHLRDSCTLIIGPSLTQPEQVQSLVSSFFCPRGEAIIPKRAAIVMSSFELSTVPITHVLCEFSTKHKELTHALFTISEPNGDAFIVSVLSSKPAVVSPFIIPTSMFGSKTIGSHFSIPQLSKNEAGLVDLSPVFSLLIATTTIEDENVICTGDRRQGSSSASYMNRQGYSLEYIDDAAAQGNRNDGDDDDSADEATITIEDLKMVEVDLLRDKKLPLSIDAVLWRYPGIANKLFKFD